MLILRTWIYCFYIWPWKGIEDKDDLFTGKIVLILGLINCLKTINISSQFKKYTTPLFNYLLIIQCNSNGYNNKKV